METLRTNPSYHVMHRPKEPIHLYKLVQPVDVNSIDITDDVSLMRLLSLRHTDALTMLYDRYSRLVYSIAINVIGDQAVAEEIVQDVFTRVWEKAGTFDARIAKLSTWLVSITRNRAIDELRRCKIRPENTSVSWEDVSEVDNPQSPGPEGNFELSWRQSSVREALAAISPEQREALTLAYFKGYSQSEIARLLRIPLGTVKSRIRSAMQNIRLFLSQAMEMNP